MRGVRVLDLSNTLAGAYATKMLADAGAEVITVEPADGHPLRRTELPLFQYLHTSKRSVRASVPDDELAD
ncbi:MAG TPA: CoA transferase, partial [Mycobacteriales bacterium]|nr:CoA transferase [Mycobacteriales bacterium]